MPGVAEQREHHGHWQGKGEKRAEDLIHGRSVYERASRAKVDEDAGPEHGHRQHRGQRDARRGWERYQ